LHAFHLLDTDMIAELPQPDLSSLELLSGVRYTFELLC
jgi:hypothetical protein